MNQKIKILIVEDEVLIAANLKFTLADLGYEVVDVCHKYSTAEAAILRADADLVMLDINLGSATPGRTGLELAALLRTRGGDKPFIFLTAYNDKDTILKATRLGPSGYLMKPANPVAIFAAIQSAMERHHDGKTTAAPADLDAANGNSPERPLFFFVKVGARHVKILWKEVARLEKGKNYVRIRVFGQDMEYPLRGTLSFVYEQLMPQDLQPLFLRVNRAVCIHKETITAYGPDWVACGTERFENTRYSIRELDELIGKRG